MNISNRDLEVITLYANKCYGYQTLSTGETVLIKELPITSKELGESLKKMSERIKKSLNQITIEKEDKL